MRTDVVPLAQAKAEIRALVERDFNRKSSRCRKRQARFMEDHTKAISAEGLANPPAISVPSAGSVAGVPATHPQFTEEAEQGQHRSSEVPPTFDSITRIEAFTDDETLPVFEAALDLPRSPAAAVPTNSVPVMEKDNG